MSGRRPMVQILMAVYNGEEYLCEQVDSLLSQTFGDWELLVSDDASSDGSLAILQEYARRDERIHVVLEGEHYGSAKRHFMALLRLADAPYVMTCDQDDVWDPDKIEVTLRAMRDAEEGKGERPLLVCTDLRVVDGALREISPSFLAYSGMDASTPSFGYFLASCLVTGCTMMVNRHLLGLLQRPARDESVIMHDWWASLIAAAFGEVIHLDRATIAYRQHGDNSVGADRFTVRRALAALEDKRATERAALRQGFGRAEAVPARCLPQGPCGAPRRPSRPPHEGGRLATRASAQCGDSARLHDAWPLGQVGRAPRVTRSHAPIPPRPRDRACPGRASRGARFPGRARSRGA